MPNSHRSMIALLVLGLAGAAGTIACVDVTPITDVPVDLDAGIDVSVSPLVSQGPCFQCASGAAEAGPSCGNEGATCVADTKCLSFFLCGIPRDCYAPGTDRIECLTACGTAAGVTGLDDPGLLHFGALYRCATTTCAAECGSGQ
jgi:hypothetical protein